MTAFKAWVQVAFAVLAAVIPAITSTMDTAAWVNVVILGAGALMVYNAANVPGWPYAKLVASAVSAVAVLLASFLDGGVTTIECIQMAMAAVGAIGVGVFPNAGTTNAPG